MPRYEYKVVPAPEKGKRGKGVKGVQGRFAHALESVMNTLGADGWEYLRTDTLPCEERTGLTGRTTNFQNMLVFRRAIESDAEGLQDTEVTALLAAPVPTPAPAHSKSEAAAAAAAALRAHRSAPQGTAPAVGPATTATSELAAE